MGHSTYVVIAVLREERNPLADQRALSFSSLAFKVILRSNNVPNQTAICKRPLGQTVDHSQAVRVMVLQSAEDMRVR